MLFQRTLLSLSLAAFSVSGVSVNAAHIRRSPVPAPGLAPASIPVPASAPVVARQAAAPPAPPPPPPAKCTKGKKLKRKAWHTLSNKEKKDYINAELCLLAKPATLGLPFTTNRFEELQSIHQIPASITHGVGAFLPYHRLHMHAHEKALREECGYKGAQPRYWDEPRDAGHFSQSDVLDPVTGFGGNGTGPPGPGTGTMGCIQDGPFANVVDHLGPGYRQGTPHCIYRFVNDTVSRMSGQAYVDECMAKTTYLDFWPCVESAPHVGGHGGVGGKMLDPIASPGDPTFYLHHTWLDKIFWDWQALDLPARFSDISGRNLPLPPGSPPPAGNGLPLFLPELGKFPPLDSLVPPADSPLPHGDPGNTTTLTHILDMMGVIPSATIADVMDIGGPLLCYEYV
ncbi:tyrosinase [Echria macrotheca]|uniref:Tyrosinase n=1 Tax=Echria macrotheca TaxID=438768 RepID=A0AAJ0F694_9PEZI|nr:tyrosinase [Echria macrotheca]